MMRVLFLDGGGEQEKGEQEIGERR